MRQVLFLLVLGLTALSIGFWGCSDTPKAAEPDLATGDDAEIPDTTPDTNTIAPDTVDDDVTPVRLMPIDSLVSEIAPGVYQSPSSAPGEIAPGWIGQGALLEKTFGDEEKTSLHIHVDRLQALLDQLVDFAHYDNGAIVPDLGWVTITALSAATTVPANAQAVIGTTVDLDQLAHVSPPGQDEFYLGFKATAYGETMLLYCATVAGSELVYAHFNKGTAAIDLRGVVWSEMGGTDGRRVYQLRTMHVDDFLYRTAWYHEDTSPSFLGTVVGGGNNDEGFGVKYRQYVPANAADPQSEASLEQIFTPGFGDGGDDFSGYGEFVADSALYRYEDLAGGPIANPWSE